MTEFVTQSETETADAGRTVARNLRPGDVVLLSGPLGAGKTAFVRGMAAELGCDPDDVSSPTFTLIQEYRGRVTLYHVDLYRLDAIEAADLGLDDLSGQGVVAVEWPDRWASAPERATRIEISAEGENDRLIRVAYAPQ